MKKLNKIAINKICKKCGKEFEVFRTISENGFQNVPKYEREFCSRSCANGHVHSEEWKRKISLGVKLSLKKPKNIKKKKIYGYCKTCNKLLKYGNKTGYCVDCYRSSSNFKLTMSIVNKKNASSLKERKRLGEIGRKGGFGKKGYTKVGIYFQSSLEEKCFNFLEDKNIRFDPHKYLPNSSRLSDIYLVDKDIWIELDGIDRDRVKNYESFKKSYEKWLDKIELYKENKLNFYVVKKYEEFVELILNLGA